MLRQWIKAWAPLRIKWLRTVGGGVSESTFQKNSVPKEQQLSKTLRAAMPGITYLSVEDISGGCGAMFEISVEAKEFEGLSRVKQHRLVTETLKSEIAEMHGIRIHTNLPRTDDSFKK